MKRGVALGCYPGALLPEGDETGQVGQVGSTPLQAGVLRRVAESAPNPRCLFVRGSGEAVDRLLVVEVDGVCEGGCPGPGTTIA